MFITETVRGTHYEMGLEQGRLFRHVIQANVHTWVMRHAFLFSDAQMDAFVEESRRSDEALAPWVFKELQGIAEGSGVALPWIQRLHWRLWNKLPAPPPAGTACTAIGLIAADEGPVVGGTLDDPRDSYVLIRRIPRDGIPHLMIHWAGTVWGHNGVNEAGLAIASASVGWFEPKLPMPKEVYGLPGTTSRQLLETCATVSEGLAFLRRARTFGSLVLADASGAMSAVQTYGPCLAVEEPKDGMIFLTNHICMPALVAEGARHGCRPGITDYSRTRYEVLEKYRKQTGRSLAVMEELCRSHEGHPHSICNDGTVMASFAAPRKERGHMHIADRPPCRNPFMMYSISEKAEPVDGDSPRCAVL